MTTDLLERVDESAAQAEDPPHIGCRRHRPDLAFCGVEVDPDQPWETWRGQPACPLCVLVIERARERYGLTPCQVCVVLQRGPS